MITNSDGWVAVRYFKHHNKYVNVGAREYVFTLQNKSVSMAWVHPDDVQKLLTMKHQCCPGGSPKSMFRLANQQEVNLWTGVGDVHAR